ncbi:recombinase family protein [Streptomyces sp. NPDC059349]|uniref:recombinase family protein n=1 Tax=Streptomyces sp. NPDC059349 TaxID=3346808 RepID=UPI0036AC0513
MFTDIRQEREELWKCLGYLRPGDTLVVPSIDRFGRPIQDLISIVAGLRKCGIGFQSLHESLDTTTPGGHLVFPVCAALAEFICELIVQGTHDLIGHLSASARQHPRRRWRATTRVLGQSGGDAAGVEEAQPGGWLQEELGRPVGAAADAGFIVEDRAQGGRAVWGEAPQAWPARAYD